MNANLAGNCGNRWHLTRFILLLTFAGWIGINPTRSCGQEQSESLKKRASILAMQGSYKAALADLRRARAKAPQDYVAPEEMAWIWATATDPRARDGEKAVAAATTACELTLWQDASPLATLAAAYAESDDFDSAVKWQTRAIELRDTKVGRDRLELYTASEPLRIPLPASKPLGPVFDENGNESFMIPIQIGDTEGFTRVTTGRKGPRIISGRGRSSSRGLSGFASLMLLAVVVMALIFIPLSMLRSAHADEAWTTAAKTMQLHFQEGGLFQSRKISGRSGQFDVVVDTYTVRHGQHGSTTYTRFQVGYPSLGLSLELKEEGFWSGVGKLLGSQDITTGDPQFDQWMLVKGSRPERVREFLAPARRMRIYRFFRSYTGATIDDHKIGWRCTGVVLESDRLVNTVQAMIRIASHLTDRESDRVLQRAIEAQEAGRSEETVQLLAEHRKHSNSDSLGPEEHLLEGEILSMADRAEEAADAFERAQSHAPDDPEIAEWIQRPAEVPASETPMSELDQEAVCRALFESNLSSYRVTQSFERRYAGKTIHWSGILTRGETFSYDLIFGNGPACRAVVQIYELSETGYTGQTVKAIVHLPADLFDQLRRREGETISFTGEMAKVDPLMRNLFIRAGALE